MVTPVHFDDFFASVTRKIRLREGRRPFMLDEPVRELTTTGATTGGGHTRAARGGGGDNDLAGVGKMGLPAGRCRPTRLVIRLDTHFLVLLPSPVSAQVGRSSGFDNCLQVDEAGGRYPGGFCRVASPSHLRRVNTVYTGVGDMSISKKSWGREFILGRGQRIRVGPGFGVVTRESLCQFGGRKSGGQRSGFT